MYTPRPILNKRWHRSVPGFKLSSRSTETLQQPPLPEFLREKLKKCTSIEFPPPIYATRKKSQKDTIFLALWQSHGKQTLFAVRHHLLLKALLVSVPF